MSHKIKHSYEFEDFRLNTKNPSLWRGDKLVSISPKALETLILLIERRGEIVSREDLLETVWKDTFVEEGNINYTISLLRKTLENKELIQTVSRRGYRFVAEVREISLNETNLADEIAPIQIQTQTTVAKSPTRWIFALVLLVGILCVTGLAYWSRSGKTVNLANTPENTTSEAMQAYTRGKMIMGKRNVENREEKAIDEFQKAVTLDPTLALAYAGLAEAYVALAIKDSNAQSDNNYAKAKSAVGKALELDANLMEGYLIRGWIKRNADWNWKGAEADLRRAIEINPQNAVAHQRLSYVLSPLGKHDEALKEIQLAYQLDPIADNVLGARFPILEARGEYDEALKEAEIYLRENKGNNNALRVYATFHYHKSDYAKVIELGENALGGNSIKSPFAWYSLLAAAYQKTGQTEKSSEFLEKLKLLTRSDTRAIYSLAMNYAENGQIDEAIDALRKCLELHEERMSWIAVEPRFANLKNDSRFRQILSEMHLN